MEQNICRGCTKPLINTSNTKDIFHDDFIINASSTIKIYAAMEQIIGQKVLKGNELSEKMCENCYKKLEVCINFKSQLLNSFNMLFKNITNQEVVSTLDVDDENLNNATQDENSEYTIVNAEDQINVDENSSSNEITSEDERIMGSIREEQDNNNINAPESPAVYINSSCSPTDNLIKIMDNDIESDIDVCSGEDDEILELDMNIAKNEAIDLDNSSGSDIDVCDYEPSGKRIRNYNTLSPSIQF